MLNIGVISPRKRQVELLERLTELHRQGLKFEVQFIGRIDAGDAYGSAFLRRIAEAEQRGYARYLGCKSTQEMIACMDQSAGLIHFPTEEAFGLVVAEALARGLKFFGARLGGIKDISADVPGAELFEAEDWSGLVSAISRWMRNGHPKIAEAARLMESRYHPELIARRHLEIYREVLRRDS